MVKTGKNDSSVPSSDGTLNRYRLLLLAPALLALGGCRHHSVSTPPSPASLVAAWTDDAVTPDGRLEESVWDRAPTYPLHFTEADSPEGLSPTEPGSVRLAWDSEYLYAAFVFQDSDVIEEGDADQLQQQRTGDVAELFLKPAGRSWYWEFHATAHGRHSAFFFPSRGRAGLPSNFDYQSGIEAGATVDGTLNVWSDLDQSWTVEIAIPLRDLTVQGEAFSPDTEWRVLAARYNYALILPAPELSSAPRLPRTSFHDHDHYGILQFQAPTNADDNE